MASISLLLTASRTCAVKSCELSVRQRCHTLFIAYLCLRGPLYPLVNPGMDSSAQTLHTDADSNVRLSVREFPSHPCFCRIRESPWRFTTTNHSIISNADHDSVRLGKLLVGSVAASSGTQQIYLPWLSRTQIGLHTGTKGLQ